MSNVAFQIWLTFLLNILKDILWAIFSSSGRFRRVYLWFRRRYLIARTPFNVFVKRYKNFIREKNEIFEIMMGDYSGEFPNNPVFFFSSLTKYWLLKRTLIQQYEKSLNIHLIDTDYDIFEDDIKRGRIIKVKDSLNKLILKLKIIDPEFRELFEKWEENIFLLSNWRKNLGQGHPGGSSVENVLRDYSPEEAGEFIDSYIRDERTLISSWNSSGNTIKNLEKFDLYTDTKIVQKYMEKLGLSLNLADVDNLLPISFDLYYVWVHLMGKVSPKQKKRFISSERSYARIYYRLLINKYIQVESRAPRKELSNSDAALIIKRSCFYCQERNSLLDRNVDDMADRWHVAYRLWELNEIRKNICQTYLETEEDPDKFMTNFERIVNLASKSNIGLDKEDYSMAEIFLRERIKPADFFEQAPE